MNKDELEREKKRAKREQLELTFLQHARALKLDTTRAPMEREYAFHDERKWRFDFAWPTHLVAVEVEGLTYEGGRHQRIGGYESDCEKYNAAQLAGWIVLRFAGSQVRSGRAGELTERALEQRDRWIPQAGERSQ